MLTARSMDKNLTISGIPGDEKNEKCKDSAVQFLKEQVEIDVDESEIYVAHRIGQRYGKKPGTMIIRCQKPLKDRILQNARNLKDKTNQHNDPYYVNKQLPDQLAEQNREIRAEIRKQKEKDKGLKYNDRAKIEVKDKTVLIDGHPVKKHILPVQVYEHFPDKAEREKQDKIKLSVSESISQDGSIFQAYAIKSGQIHEIKRAYQRVRRTHPSATHVVAAYNIKAGSGFQDDQEYGAGFRLARDLETNYQPNTAVFVVRIYGGRHLGAKRFTLYSEVAKQALTKVGAELLPK